METSTAIDHLWDIIVINTRGDVEVAQALARSLKYKEDREVTIRKIFSLLVKRPDFWARVSHEGVQDADAI